MYLFSTKLVDSIHMFFEVQMHNVIRGGGKKQTESFPLPAKNHQHWMGNHYPATCLDCIQILTAAKFFIELFLGDEVFLIILDDSRKKIIDTYTIVRLLCVNTTRPMLHVTVSEISDTCPLVMENFVCQHVGSVW